MRFVKEKMIKQHGDAIQKVIYPAGQCVTGYCDLYIINSQKSLRMVKIGEQR